MLVGVLKHNCSTLRCFFDGSLYVANILQKKNDFRGISIERNPLSSFAESNYFFLTFWKVTKLRMICDILKVKVDLGGRVES